MSTSSAAAARSGNRAPRWESWWQDARHAARALRRSPGLTLAIVITLGLGIGANATMFGVVDRLLFRASPYMTDADRVHRLYFSEITPRDGERTWSSMSYFRFTQLDVWATSADPIAAFTTPRLAIGTGDDAREMEVAVVSASFWRLFDARPSLGRFFTADEDRIPEGTAVAVLGHAFWQTRYGERRDVIGQSVTIGTSQYTIIGVAPPGFTGIGVETPAVFIPITAYAGREMRGGFFSRRGTPPPPYHAAHNMSWLEVIARRRPGVSAEAMAQELSSAYRRSRIAELTAANRSLAEIDERRPRMLAAPVQRERGPNAGQDTKVARWLTGVSAIVLLIACANVGNLLLARAFGRRREIAVRLALGVGRGRLLRQLLTESLLLALLGAAVGVMLAQWAGGIVRVLLLGNTVEANAITDARVLLYALGAAIVTGVLTGMAPAVMLRRDDLTTALRAGAREGTYHRSRLRIALLVLQGALSVVLLVGAGLFVRSLRNVRGLDLGYDPSSVLYVEAQMRGVRLAPEAREELHDRLRERAAQLPLAAHAARGIAVPFWMSITQTLSVAGIDSVHHLGDFYYHAVSPEYFPAMGTRLLRGRGIEPTDTKSSAPVMVVSASMARTLWPGRDALGQCVRVGADTMPCTTVVGIAQDIRRESLSEDTGLQYYVPITQANGGGGLFVRTRASNGGPMAEEVRKALQAEMPGVSYVTVTPLADIVAPELRSWTLGATMFTAFGVLALVLAGVGLYSVIAYNVAQRTHELGVRLALGAQGRDLVRLVLGEGVRLMTIGLALGAVAALLAGRWVGPLLFETTATDPVVFGGVAALLGGVAALACVLPSARAARVEPAIALRAD